MDVTTRAPTDEVAAPVFGAEAPAPHPSITDAIRTDTRAWLGEVVDGRVGLVLAVAWFVLIQVAAAIEPPARESEPFIGVLLEITMYLLLATMVTGFVMQRRFGLVASLGAAVLATAASIACPISGHHQFGTWWYGQMACVLVLVGISVAAIYRTGVERPARNS